MIQRYATVTSDGFLCGAHKHPDGEYIKYSDHLAALSTEAEKVRKLREALGAVVMGNDICYERKLTIDSWPESAICKEARIALKETGD